MKIVTVLGARPQFIKAAAVSKKIREKHNEIIIHTGQHYDSNMSEIFFSELNIPKPDYNLQVGSGGHGFQTGNMLIQIEEILKNENPELTLVYGDTNSTLAGALASSKMLIPVAHVEAGLRSFNKNMPEEQNRILTDHLSKYLFVPTRSSEKNLGLEGISSGVYNVGDVMYDAILHFGELAKVKSKVQEELGVYDNDYILATIHRAENTNDINRLTNIVNALNECNRKIVLPLHPRTKKYINDYGLRINDNIVLIEPVGYLDMISLEVHSNRIVTDSGGVQKEAYFMNKPCITLRDETEWVETVENGWNVLAGTNRTKILDSILNFHPLQKQNKVFGNGNAAELISAILND